MGRWIELGGITELSAKPLQEVTVDGKSVALTYHEGEFGAVSGVCLHVGGPLTEGRINEQGYVVCPWHQWMFHCKTGQARPGIPAQVARYALKTEGGKLYIDAEAVTQDKHASHAPHPLTRGTERAAGRLRVAGISTTVVNRESPRVSTSERLLEEALAHAGRLGAETRLIKLNDLKFRACEGYYSRSAQACTWPCTITQMDPSDELDRVYEAMVFWADVILVATPIRWGAASSLYYKMVERMNCVQNQETLTGRTLIKDKVAGFIITGGQDNIQAVVGQMMTFFTEIGYVCPPRAFVGWSRGWAAEDMENNVKDVLGSEDLKNDVHGLVERCVRAATPLTQKPAAAAVPAPPHPASKVPQKAPYVLNAKPGEYRWCSCGESSGQPFCDGSHARGSSGKTPLKVKIETEKRVAWCGCKASKTGAFCDGTHATL